MSWPLLPRARSPSSFFWEWTWGVRLEQGGTWGFSCPRRAAATTKSNITRWESEFAPFLRNTYYLPASPTCLFAEEGQCQDWIYPPLNSNASPPRFPPFAALYLLDKLSSAFRKIFKHLPVSAPPTREKSQGFPTVELVLLCLRDPSFQILSRLMDSDLGLKQLEEKKYKWSAGDEHKFILFGQTNVRHTRKQIIPIIRNALLELSARSWNSSRALFSRQFCIEIYRLGNYNNFPMHR